ncbi:MAG: hypothetical protein WC992_03060 [Acholeplasmataceae bacterium]|jgi:hypothetical protein
MTNFEKIHRDAFEGLAAEDGGVGGITKADFRLACDKLVELGNRITPEYIHRVLHPPPVMGPTPWRDPEDFEEPEELAAPVARCPVCGECDEVLIWKPDCRLWYRPNRSGYTALVVRAGRYWRCEAQEDVRSSRGELVLDTAAEALERNTPDVGGKYVNGLMVAGEAQSEALASALVEMVGLMHGVMLGDYKPDSFTTQPAMDAIRAFRQYQGRLRAGTEIL